MVRWSTLAPLAALLLALAAPARAEGPTAKEQAAALLTEATHHYDRGDYPGALERFWAAYAAFPTPKIFFNVGLTELKLGHPAAAADAFDRFLDGTLESEALAPHRQVAKAQLLTLSRSVARLRLDVSPPEAALSVDGKALQRSSVYLEPGPHRVEATLTGYRPRTEEVSLIASENRVLSLRLELELPAPVLPKPAPAPAPVAKLEPAPPRPEPAGGLTRPEPPPAGVRPLPVALLATGGALLLASGALGYLAHRDDAALAEAVSGGRGALPDSEIDRLRGPVRTEAWLSTGALALGLGAAGAGAALWLLGE